MLWETHVQLATKHAGDNAAMVREAVRNECRNIALYMDNFRSLMLNKLGPVNAKLAKRAQIHTHVHLWKAPSCFTRMSPPRVDPPPCSGPRRPFRRVRLTVR
jgi:hypothetical protein